MAERPKQVKADDTEVIAQLEEEAAATLPPPGYERDELLRSRQDALQEQVEQMATLINQGALDTSKMEMFNEIQNQADYLYVSNWQPGMVYGWVSKNNYGNNHFQKARLEGWEVVQGDDPEALELKGTTRLQAGGPPDTTRHLGDVILMRIPEERYIALKAREHARAQALQSAADANLMGLAHSLRDKGVIIRPFDMDAGGGEGSGRSYSRQGAMKMMDRALRTGTVPGMHVEQR